MAVHPDFAQNGLVYVAHAKTGERGITTALTRGRLDGDRNGACWLVNMTVVDAARPRAVEQPQLLLGREQGRVANVGVDDPEHRAHVATGGLGVSSSDEEILQAMELLAETEGIFTEPAGGTTLAATRALIQRGVIKPNESVVICVTGNGYKTAEVMRDRLEKPLQIGRSFADFAKVVAPHSQLVGG
mgnify:CR=1 FL=1